MKKIGIFGGTFDPIHNAHLKIAAAARAQLGLDFVLMMTSGNPPHKQNKSILDAKIRHIMVKRAVCGADGLVPFDFELNKDKPCYSSETLAELREKFAGDELYFIIGGDSLRDFHTWHRPEEICRLCTLCVYMRGEPVDVGGVERRFGAKIKTIGGDFFDISSSEIRSDPANLRFCPDIVAEFIGKYRLYRDNGSPESFVRSVLPEARYRHSVGVAELAVRLGEIYGEDTKKLHLAGILHDIAKPIPYEEGLVMCDELEAELDGIERKIPPLLHAKLGAELVKCYFGIREGSVTSAIRHHTVGAPGMSRFDKIIFTADMCEENRSFDSATEIRAAAFENIDRACIMCIDAAERFNRAKNSPVHPISAVLRDELMRNL